jgi:hypothetical protein
MAVVVKGQGPGSSIVYHVHQALVLLLLLLLLLLW